MQMYLTYSNSWWMSLYIISSLILGMSSYVNENTVKPCNSDHTGSELFGPCSEVGLISERLSFKYNIMCFLCGKFM